MNFVQVPLSSASPLRIAMIGVGRPLNTPGATGFGMAHRHMAGYQAYGGCELVALVDTNRENAEAFASEHNPEAAIFEDHLRMLAVARPDVVSVCLWPHLHAEVVCALAESEHRPRIIFCEKPMDVHWDACLRMHAACEANGVMLTINHQRRFNLPLLKAKEILDRGDLGDLRSLRGGWHNLSDAGTHVLDMMFYYNQDIPATWVLGQVDTRECNRKFGAVQAGHGITEIRFENGVHGVYHFGKDHEELGCLLRIVAERGVIEVLNEEPWLRMIRHGQTAWEIIDTGENIHDDQAIYRAIADFLDAHQEGRIPQMHSSIALRPTEVIFATHASSQQRARINLPLPPGPDALLAMIESAELQPVFTE